jgi:glycosyltransferase involved in cell wall biosynthesis
MNENSFNVIVPTRERADTLVSTLKALVKVDYAKLKIVVCDNASLDNTREVVESFKDKRIQYSRSSERLSMAQNWQRGLSFLDDGYVTYLGDDDALLIGAIPQLNTILSDHCVKAIAWDKIEYPWPNCTIDAIRGRLLIPLSNSYEFLSGHKIRNSVKKMDVLYTRLPCLYNSFVDVGLVKSLDKEMPFFQGALAPDLYAGIALSYHVGDYIYSRRPFSISGASAHSNGASAFFSKDKSAANKFNSEIDIQIDDRLMLGPSMVVATAMEFWNVYRHFEHEDCYLDINEIVLKTKAELLRLDGHRYADVYSLLKKIIEKNGMEPSILNGLPDSVPEAVTVPSMGFKTSSNKLAFDSRKIGVQDVFDAARVAELLMPPFEAFKRESYLRKARRDFRELRRSLRTRNKARMSG